MLRFVAKRALYALVTLLLLSIVVFLMLNLLPGDPGRRILGNFAEQSAVDQLNHELGYDRPLVVQYLDWISHFLRGDLGVSYAQQRPVIELIRPALWASTKLAVLAFVIVVPLSVGGGVLAAVRKGRMTDRAVTIAGLSGIAIPEFVSGFVLIFVFAITLGWLPGTAVAPEGAGPLEVIKHLLLPALTLVIVLFGYIARMARAGTIDALESDATRTAVLKGLPRSRVFSHHVLRNGLLPTITVVATQAGYLIGGLVAVERTFNSPGLGRLLLDAVNQKDFPLLQSAVLVVGIVYLVSTLLADVAIAALNPRVREAVGA